METYVSSLLWTISWQVTVLFVFIFAAESIIRHPSPLFRSLLWSIIPLRLLVPFPIPYIGELVHQFGGPATTTIGTIANFTQHQINTTLESLPFAVSQAHPESSSQPDIVRLVVVGVWFGVVIALALNWLMKLLILRKRIHGYAQVTDERIRTLCNRLTDDLGLKSPIELLIMDRADSASPMVTGLFRPKILLPAYLLDSYDKDTLEPIILHELVHVKRGDLWINWLLSIVHIFYFFHPVAWIVNSRLLALSEDTTDDLSILYLEGSRKAYFSSILLVLERIAERSRLLKAEACCIERKSSLSKRIIRLTRPTYSYYRPLSMRSIAAACVIGFIGILFSSVPINGTIVTPSPDQQTSFILVAYGSGNIQLRVHAGDTFEINGKQVTFTDLKRLLTDAMIDRNSNRLLVLIDSNVNELTLTSINDMAFRIGYREISFRWMSFDDDNKSATK